MSSSSSYAYVAVVLVMAMVVVAPYGANAITCSDVYKELYPCLSYVQGGGGSVPTACCGGLRSLVAGATAKSDRQTACSCIETAFAGATSQEWSLATGLPAKCGINVPFTISASTDCSKVN